MKLLVAFAGLALISNVATADAKPKREAKTTKSPTRDKRESNEKSAKRERKTEKTAKRDAKTDSRKHGDDGERRQASRDDKRDAKHASSGEHRQATRDGDGDGDKASARSTITRKKKPDEKRGRKQPKRIAMADLGPAPGQSVGAPWHGRLQDASHLEPSETERYVIRRPARAFGTHAAVGITKQVIDSLLDDFPDVHVLAIGDMSAETGGPISQHRSHQAGRDIDLGLFYNKQPTSYPGDFVGATPDNIDPAMTFALIDAFADTVDQDGGVQMMFLDYKVQGILYEWAKEHQVEVERLDKLFQYPDRGGNGIVRHEPNHDNHVHIRFKCPSDDTHCVN